MLTIVRKEREKQEQEARIRGGKHQYGRNYCLSPEDEILLCLMYMRSYTSFLSLGTIFGRGETSVWRIQRKIEILLVTTHRFVLPKRKEITQQELEELLIDATESQIERPQRKQQQYYSWKKKRHTIKTQVIRNRTWEIMRVEGVNGRVHDKKLSDRSRKKYPIHKNTKKRVDSWYQWIQNEESNVILPKKWSKKHPLTQEEKKENREKSKLRIFVEHTMARIKAFKITSYPYRNRRKRFSLRMNLIYWILNYELNQKKVTA